MQNFCIQRFKPLAKDAEFLHRTAVVRIVAKLPESKICRISASNVFKPLAKIKDAEFLHHTLVARKVAILPEIMTCRISAFNFFHRPFVLAIIYSPFSPTFWPAVKNTLS